MTVMYLSCADTVKKTFSENIKHVPGIIMFMPYYFIVLMSKIIQTPAIVMNGVFPGRS